jgi:hypothetical protein
MQKNNRYIALTAFALLSSVSYFSKDIPNDTSYNLSERELSNLFVSRSIIDDSDIKNINNYSYISTGISLMESIKKSFYKEESDISEILSNISSIKDIQNLKIIKINSGLLLLLQRNRRR